MIKTKSRFKHKLLTILLLFSSNLLFFLTLWLGNKYDHVSLDQFIYQAKTSAAGANTDLVNSALVQVGLFGVLLTGFEILLYLLCSGYFTERFQRNARYIKFCSLKICRFITRHVLPIVLVFLLLSAVFSW